ncbi:unnamed protein product [Medioppia subpectinata]|uniref:Chitosanase n=2 Tax=Medioppia subpectinata TaxID=1979941 RepID=A0A7R9Q354_9ACAR|nr:unnamed protein product [Medioppia subpectinata]CAG2110960.1 unnamed protein product [Medioppia subpectinata]
MYTFLVAGAVLLVEAELMTPQQRLRCEQFISFFENETIDIQYDYVEDMHDGRGYTCGKFGFTTCTGDALDLIQKYTAKKPANPLAPFLPELVRLAREFSNDTSGLGGYPEAWKTAAKDQLFRDTQDEVSAAIKYAERAGIKTAMGKCAIYDCIIEHGNNDDGDSLGAIFNRTWDKEKGGVKSAATEQYWIRSFLNMRLDDFDNPREPINIEHHTYWHDMSVQRVYAMITILNEYNMNLDGPIYIKTQDHHVNFLLLKI